MISESGHATLSSPHAVHQANTFLRQASETTALLELRGLSFSWRMVHLGQGIYMPGDTATHHLHEQLQLESAVSGQFRFEDDAGSTTISPGESLFVAPHKRHCWVCTCEGFMLGALINVGGAAETEFLHAVENQIGGMVAVNPASCVTWQRELFRMLTAPGALPWRIPAISSVLNLLLIDLLNGLLDLSAWNPGRLIGEPAADARSEALCRHAHEFLEANYGQPIQVADIAMQIGISPRHLNRLYSRIKGESIGGTLQRLRLEHARRQLREHPEDLVKTVAYRCGFNSPAYFTACYRKAFGCAPASDRYLGA